MKGIVIVNGYPNGEKFLRQGERIAAELRKLGVEVSLVKNGEIFGWIEENGDANVSCLDADFAVYLDKDKYLGRLLEGRGIRLFNSAKAVEVCDDKFTTYQALSGSAVRVVKSIPAPLCYTPNAEPNAELLKKIGEELGYPLVVKKSYGSFGAGVQLVHGYPELLSLEKEWLRVPHFYQRYISVSAGRDIRVLVVGGRAIAAMKRVAQEGEFRSNVELGGRGEPVDLPLDYKGTAERVAAWLELDYCGVDLLQTPEGPIVCEVNSNAFFEGLEGVTGMNIARAYAEYIYAKMHKLRK